MSSRVRSGRVIEAALRKKGFRVDATRDHVYFYFLKLDGEDSKIFTKGHLEKLPERLKIKGLSPRPTGKSR